MFRIAIVSLLYVGVRFASSFCDGNHWMYPPTPRSGNIKSFTLTLSRGQLPGHDREQVQVNGSVPGPTLYANVGDQVEVLVINEIYDDISTIHWHGMTLRNVSWMDGTIGYSQCPISNVPGMNTFLYRFVPEMPGTYWYHGHVRGQYSDGEWNQQLADQF